MKNKTILPIIAIVAAFGLFQAFSVRVNAQVPSATGSDSDESAATTTDTFVPTTVDTNASDGTTTTASTTVPAVSTTTATTTISATGSNGDEGMLTPFNQGSNGDEGLTIPVNQGSNGDEGVLIPTNQGSNGDDNGTTTTATSTPTEPTTPIVVTNNGGGGGSSFSSSGSFYGGNSVVPFSSSPLVATAANTTPFTGINSCPLITSYMQLGANNNGQQVALLQAFLKNSQNIDADVTGVFDQKTDTAVRAFQTRYLTDTMGPWGANQASGYVYITTTKKINELACNTPLTLSPSDVAIIDAYKSQQGQIGSNNGAVGQIIPTVEAATNAVNNAATTTPPTPQVGQGTPVGQANVAAVANTSVLQNMWNFIKGLF